MLDGCCSAYKMKIVEQNEDGNIETLWLSRHGAGGSSEEPWMNRTCKGEESNYYSCTTQTVTIHGDKHNHTDDARVCHCNTDLCNGEVPNTNKATPLKFAGLPIYVLLLATQSYLLKVLVS